MSKEISRTARPTLNENFSLLLSSLANSQTFWIHASTENSSRPPGSCRLVLVAVGMLISTQSFFPFIFQWSIHSFNFSKLNWIMYRRAFMDNNWWGDLTEGKGFLYIWWFKEEGGGLVVTASRRRKYEWSILRNIRERIMGQ